MRSDFFVSNPASMTKPSADLLLQHFDRCLVEQGDTALGANWPNEKDRRTRFDVMLDVIKSDGNAPLVLCDLGCGTGELLASTYPRARNKEYPLHRR